MAMPGSVAVDEAGSGAFGSFSGTQDGEADAILDRLLGPSIQIKMSPWDTFSNEMFEE